MHLLSELLYAIGYVVYHVGFELMRGLCEAEGARCVAATRCEGEPRFAAVSGVVTTVTLGLQSMLQFFFSRSCAPSTEFTFTPVPNPEFWLTPT